jgi:hypothetical protein
MFWNRKSDSEWLGPTDVAKNLGLDLKPASRQFYSVGQAEDNQIALTLYGQSGISATSIMNVTACKQLIYMLQSAVEVAEAEDQIKE